MNRTKIEWVKNPRWEWTDDTGTIHVSGGEQGYTWNPITGCLNGCEYCYARKLANTRLRERYLANPTVIPTYLIGGCELDKATRADPFYPRFWPERLDDLRTWTPDYMMPPRGIFVCDMGELFGNWVPREWQEKVFNEIKTCPQHRFYLLTKQPQNLIKWSPFPDNCWVGVTTVDSFAFASACGYLRDIQAKVKYLSIEPYLGMIINTELTRMMLKLAGINQVIIGAQTKPYKPPKIEHVQEIVEACYKARIPVFLKDNLLPIVTASGKPLYIETRSGGLAPLIRQEMPGGNS